MLQTLKIESVALIDKVELNFDESFNVISGETGAGKSIMLDALSFVFGGRANRSLIRENESRMRVDAVFSDLSLGQKDFVRQETGIEIDDELFLSRELDIKGKNTCRLNGELVPVGSVKKICSRLIDIHGQSEHLSVLDPNYQLKIVDLFSKEADQYLGRIGTLIERINEINREIKSLGGSKEEQQNLIDLYSYQLSEIERAAIQPNEYESLLAERKVMQEFEKIDSALRQVYDLTGRSNFEDSAQEKIAKSVSTLHPISDLKPEYGVIAERLNSVQIELEDINAELTAMMRDNVFDEERFREVDARLDFIKTLFRKYGGDYQSLMDFYTATKAKLDNLKDSESRLEALTADRERVLAALDNEQDKLSKIRKSAARSLETKLEAELKILGMPAAKIKINFDRIREPYSDSGYDVVEFMFSSNLGFELKPLNKVVSGGEMSRVMLAYKIVVGEVDDIHTIIFDEIDTGLSGRIAQVVAEYLFRLSQKKQVIAISHLPQIAAMADMNIKVEKYTDQTTTRTKAYALTGDDLCLEIARLMGVTSGGKELAFGQELKSKATLFKSSHPAS